jgi:hypothetical protein
MPDTPTSTSAASKPQDSDSSPAKLPTSFKVVDVNDHGPVLDLGDGRMFQATAKEGVEGIKRGASVTVSYSEMDKSNAPKDAQVTRVNPA